MVGNWRDLKCSFEIPKIKSGIIIELKKAIYNITNSITANNIYGKNLRLSVTHFAQ